jgi:serine/threonine-protein kinase
MPVNDDRTHSGRDSGRQPLPPDRARGGDDRTHAVPPNGPVRSASARHFNTSTNARPSARYNTSSSGEWTRRVRVGAQLADYVLEKELGEGGMGSVFVARHVTTGAEVALKVMLVDPDVNQAALDRFRREGQAQAAAGKHPNVLLVHTAGEEAGCAYIVMELARGGDLKGRLKQGPLEPRAAAELVAALARGLAHVHAHGVLHRDLKPGNVVFAEDGTPKLMDFGLARLAGAEKLTQTGTMLGTPAYMAPEQAGGEALDERADVYALGAVLYHCVTGRPPFDGASAMVLVRKVLIEKPTPPREVNPAVPASLEQVILRTLAKDAGARFPTAKALADELDRFVRGELVEPRPRGPLVLVGCGLLALSLVTAGVAWGVQRTRATDVAPVVSAAPPPPPPPPPPVIPAVSLAGLPDDWTIVDPDVSELTLTGEATGAVVEVRAGAGGADPKDLPVVATRLPARVSLRVGWSQVSVRAADAGGGRAVVVRRDVVRLREGLRRLPGAAPHVECARDGSTLVLIPPGPVLMPALNESRHGLSRRSVERPYFIGLHEVTWGQARAFARATGTPLPPHEVPTMVGRVPEDRLPVYNVKYDEAQAYVEWAGLRLPTSAEWMRAAAGDDERAYPWGDTPAPGSPEWAASPRANVGEAGDGVDGPMPVGSFEGGRSPFGLHDAFGNVWEWVAPYPAAGGVLWFYTFGSGWPNTERTVRSAGSEELDKRAENNGLRVAADVDPP